MIKIKIGKCVAMEKNKVEKEQDITCCDNSLHAIGQV